MTDDAKGATAPGFHTNSHRFSTIPARAFDDTRLGAAPLKLLGILGCYSNRDGWCWPSIATLAKRMGVESRQAIQKHLAALVTLGYIKRQRQDGGVNLYRILHDVDLAPEFDRMAETEPANASVATPRQRHVASEQGVPPKSWQGCQPDVGIELTHRTNPNKEPSFKVPKGTKKPAKRKTGFPDGLCLTPKLRQYAESKTPGCDVDRMWEQFENHHRANGSMFIDWERAWYKWAGSQYQKPMAANGRYGQPQKKRPQLLDRLAAADEQLVTPPEWSN